MLDKRKKRPLIVNSWTIHTKKGSQSFGLTPSLLKRRLPTLPLLRSTIGVTGLNFSVRNGKRWNPGAITTRMGDMMNATLYLQTTNSLKKSPKKRNQESFTRWFIAHFSFRLSSLLQGQKYDLRHIPGWFSLFHSLVRFLYIIRSARQGDFPRMHTSGN